MPGDIAPKVQAAQPTSRARDWCDLASRLGSVLVWTAIVTYLLDAPFFGVAGGALAAAYQLGEWREANRP